MSGDNHTNVLSVHDLHSGQIGPVSLTLGVGKTLLPTLTLAVKHC